VTERTEKEGGNGFHRAIIWNFSGRRRRVNRSDDLRAFSALGCCSRVALTIEIHESALVRAESGAMKEIVCSGSCFDVGYDRRRHSGASRRRAATMGLWLHDTGAARNTTRGAQSGAGAGQHHAVHAARLKVLVHPRADCQSICRQRLHDCRRYCWHFVSYSRALKSRDARRMERVREVGSAKPPRRFAVCRRASFIRAPRSTAAGVAPRSSRMPSRREPPPPADRMPPRSRSTAPGCA
jgi:hypothetical protein